MPSRRNFPSHKLRRQQAAYQRLTSRLHPSPRIWEKLEQNARRLLTQKEVDAALTRWALRRQQELASLKSSLNLS